MTGLGRRDAVFQIVVEGKNRMKDRLYLHCYATSVHGECHRTVDERRWGPEMSSSVCDLNSIVSPAGPETKRESREGSSQRDYRMEVQAVDGEV